MADEDILHQDDVEKVIDDRVEETVGVTQAAIDDVDTVGGTYSQAEVNAIVSGLNDVLAALRVAGIIEESAP